MHLNSQALLARYASEYFKPGLRVLEVGPTTIPSEFVKPLCTWEYADIEERGGCLKVAPYQYPIESNTYDIVLAANVLEHVPQPWRLMCEWARIVKAAGHIITVVPVSWPYHEHPVDCWRMFPEGIKALHDYAYLETLVAEWGTLEPHMLMPGTDTIPGRSYTWLSPEERTLPLVEVAYDTIGIARKPHPATV